MRTDMMSILAVEARMGPPEAAAAAPLRGPTAWLLADFPGLIAGLPDRAAGRRLDAARLLAIPFVHGFALERAAAVAVRGEMAAAAAGAGWEPVEIPREESAGAWIAREVRRGLEEGRRPDRVILAGGDAALAEAAEAALEREIPVWVLAFPGMLRQRLLQAVLSRPRRARVVWASPAAVWAEELADRAARRRIRRCRLWPSEAAPLLAWTAEVLRSGWLQPLPADLMPLLRPSRSPFRTPEAGLAWAARHLGGSARIWREGEELWLLPEGLLPPGWDPDPEAVRPEAERLWADLFGGR
jgi:hypothetical protein